jgi:hypothetical protein
MSNTHIPINKQGGTMKQMRNILAVSVVTLSMALAGGISVSTNVNWTGLDEDGGASAGTGHSVMFGFNDNTSLGYDTNYGMLAVFDVVAGANLRLGWGTGHTIGLGYSFWSSGGDGIKTSLGVSVNFGKYAADPADRTSLNMSLGWSL